MPSRLRGLPELQIFRDRAKENLLAKYFNGPADLISVRKILTLNGLSSSTKFSLSESELRRESDLMDLCELSRIILSRHDNQERVAFYEVAESRTGWEKSVRWVFNWREGALSACPIRGR